ncbi:hypothetical protein BH10BAC4_BH10BAC4_00510 [soil metagenome]
MRAILFGLTILSFTGFSQGDSLSSARQTSAFDNMHFYLTGLVAVPSPQLSKAVNNDWSNLGVGLSSGILFNPFGQKQASPVLLGVDFSYITFGVDKIAKTPFSPPLKTTFNVYSINANARWLLGQRTGFAPFVDGMVGIKIFNTRTKIDKDLLDTVLGTDQPEVINTTNDTGLNYGLGIGFFNRKERGVNSANGSFTFRVLYVWGADAKYVVRDSITLDANNYVHYETGYTKTDMILVQLGFVLY